MNINNSIFKNNAKQIKLFSYRNILLLGICIAELIRFSLPFFYNPLDSLWSDPGRWWEYASTGIDTPPLSLIDAPLFQAWISFIAKWTLDIPELTALYAGLLSAIMPWFWYRFLRELLQSKNSALLGWLLLACLPSWTGIYSYFMSETLLLPLLGLSLWLSWRSLRKKDAGSLVLACFFWLLCSLTRGISAPIMLVVLFFVWLQQKHKIQSALLCILLSSLIMGSLSYRSYVRSGLISPLGQPLLNASYAQSGKSAIHITYYSDTIYGFKYGFSSPSIDSKPLYPFSDWTSQRSGSIKVKIDINDQAHSWKLAQQQLQLNENKSLSYSDLITENLIFLFFGSSWPDNNPQHFSEQLSIWTRFIWLPLFFLAIILLAHQLKQGERHHSPILLAVLLSWLFFQGILLISLNEGRYRKPIEGLLISSLVFGFSQRYKKKLTAIKEI
jgi:hypothetical protein